VPTRELCHRARGPPRLAGVPVRVRASAYFLEPGRRLICPRAAPLTRTQRRGSRSLTGALPTTLASRVLPNGLLTARRAGLSKRATAWTEAAACPRGATLWLNAGSRAIGLPAPVDFRNAGPIQPCHAHCENAGGSPQEQLGSCCRCGDKAEPAYAHIVLRRSHAPLFVCESDGVLTAEQIVTFDDAPPPPGESP